MSTDISNNTDSAYNLRIILEEFRNYCSAEKNLSPISIKNYVSDVKFFLHWYNAQYPLRANADILDTLSSKVIQEFKTYLIQESFPKKTINRRLSGLRRLIDFITDTNKSNTSLESITNVTDTDLEPEKVTKINSKNNTYVNLLIEFNHDLPTLNVQGNTQTMMNDIEEFFTIIHSQN